MASRILLCLFFAALACLGHGAQLRVHGQVTGLQDHGALREVLVRVYKDGVVQHMLKTNAQGRYSVRLDNNASYVLRFSLPGHVTKCYAVDTHGPSWKGDERTVDLEVGMILFERVEGIDLSFFDMPLGMARFTPMTGLVAWNEGYRLSVEAEAQRLTTAVLRQHALADRPFDVRPLAYRQ